MTLKTLRPWQAECLNKARDWFASNNSDQFLINAAPGSGKTIAACTIAKTLLDDHSIDRVVVIAPRAEVVNQWADDFDLVTDRYMGKITGSDENLTKTSMDFCATWAAIQGLEEQMRSICQSERILLVCDEHHHAALDASWGIAAGGAFENARYTLLLTGTPIRSDGNASVWLSYDSHGAIKITDDATYNLTYGEAVDLGYCRPATFHRHEGSFKVDPGDGNAISVSGKKAAVLAPELKRIPGLESALNFYKLACTPQYEKNGLTPLLTGFQASMIQNAASKLDDLRDRMPNAGGLIIAPNIAMAEYMAEVIEMIEGEPASIVHSQMPNADTKIKAFRKNNDRWLVSVAMVSEGVDIKRLRVLVYLPNAMTELAFRQAIGRVVRTDSSEDDTRAYVVMPFLEKFEQYARRVEDEMPTSTSSKQEPKTTKKCPICNSECAKTAKNCNHCGHEFPERAVRQKECHECSEINEISAESCVACGASFLSAFELSLSEALRVGTIVRGMDLDEQTVAEGEAIASKVRAQILLSGDEKLVNIIRLLPEESWSHLRKILSTS